MTKAFLLATTAGLMWVAPAHAQEMTDPVDDASVTSSADQPVVDSGEVTGRGITITAQGREQQLADVPIAVNVVNAEALQNSGANDIREINQLAPSLLVSSTGNEANGSARIRGIGTVGDNPGLESSVAVFVDGVYRSRSGNALGDLGPIERVEILRGPQGTLFGRNASAGLISIVTAQPNLNRVEAYGSASYGNYDYYRFEGGANLPLGDTFAVRLDGTYTKRDGFYRDVVNNTRINNRDRYLVRGKAMWEPTPDLTLLLSADYSKKKEACCAATFVQPEFAPLATLDLTRSPTGALNLNSFTRPTSGVALTSPANPIIPVLLALGQDPRGLTQSTFNRNIYNTPGRSFEGRTEDYGASGEIQYALGPTKLTSITAYREYENYQGSDTDYTQVDILYRAPNRFGGARQFKTFTQELRLQGQVFNDRVDWLVGGFYSNEKLQVRDNLRFGAQYGAFAPCRIVNAVNPALANPLARGCLSAGGRAVLQGANGGAGAFGGATPLIFAGLDILSRVNDLGSTGDVYNQKSENYAFFTHNIIHVLDNVDLTLGARYTNETKTFDATFGNDNVFCPQQRALQTQLLGVPALAGLAGGLISLTCQGNSSSELNGVSINDRRKEDEFTGTAVLSWKPTPELLLYGSYSRGYKAGGFNLDRSALGNPLFNVALNLNPQALQFDQETVNAYEIGAKYSIAPITLTLAAYRQEFSDFQLNTFNGSVFLVQNINGCGTGLGGTDRDASAATGGCASGDVTYGVRSQGVEVEAAITPARNVNANVGFTYTDTRYRNNLVGRSTGTPLDPALRLLPGDNLSNAPELVATASVGFTPPIGNSGLSALFYLNGRLTSDYNTGSDLLYGKEQDGFALVNGRIGIRGAEERFALEFFVQNIFDKGYTQVAFNTPFVASQQTYSAFLAEPRTYGVTVRGRF